MSVRITFWVLRMTPLPRPYAAQAQAQWCVGRPARRHSESRHDGGWRLRVATVTNCEAADLFIGSASPGTAAQGSLAGLPLSKGGGSMGRGRSREAARGSARAGTLGRGGGPRTPGSAPGASGGRSEKRKAGMVQGFQLPQEQGRSPGPRAWGVRQGRAVTCARGGVA